MKGFTLIELLIIIGIIGILVLIGIPAFRAYQPTMQLSVAARDLVSDIRYTQQLAVTEQINHGTRFSTSTGQYQIIRFGATPEILSTSTLPEKVSFQKVTDLTNDQVIFNPYGAVLESGKVTLINTKNATTVVDIRPSGFVRIIK